MGRPEASGDSAHGRTGAGTLYVVSTPIGNLGDITRRAVEVLGAVSVVAAEDTRRTRVLLSHLGLRDKKLYSLNAHSTPEAIAHFVERLRGGDDAAVVTDAGTPAVSDPGRALVGAAFQAGIVVRVLPGPSAVTAAVALCGLVEGPFSFLGFLPRSGSARRAELERICASREPSVFFESPQRMTETLRELAELMPQRAAFVGRELTKLHEESLHGTLGVLAEQSGEWRGEIVMVIAGDDSEVVPDREKRELVFECLRVGLEAGASPSRMARGLSTLSGLPRRELYEQAVAWSAEPNADHEGGDEE